MEYSLVGEVCSSFYNDPLHKLNLSIAKALVVKLSNQWSNRFDPHLGPLIVTQAQSAHEELSQCFAKSCGFSPGTPVSSHRESWQRG